MNLALKITAALVCAVALFFGGVYLGGHPDDLPSGVRKTFVNESDATKAELIDEIEERFYKKTDRDELEKASLKGIVRSLGDRFSHYLTPDESKLLEQTTTGQFSGVGMSIDEDKKGLLVVKVFNGTPAERAGIKKGDIITKVNGASIAGKSAEVATAKIKGKPGTEVTLTVETPKKGVRTIKAKRERIKIPVVESEMKTIDGIKVGVVQLAEFSHGAHGQVRTAVDKLLEDGAKGIVLDLRGNGGGLLREGILVAGVFVDKGLIVSTKGRTQSERKFDAPGGAIDEDVPVVVLVDRGSASASEIVTGALRDRGRAKVIGTRTFGKGVFQEIAPLKNGGALDVTVGRYYLPNGKPVSGKGIAAEVKAVDDPDTEKDEALPKALETLRKEISQ